MVRKYDGLYIFVGAAKDETLDKTVDKMRGEITRLSGTILSTEVLGKRSFARPMQKRDHGTYVRIRFELDPASLATLRQRYHLAEDLFRVQLLSVNDRREAIVAEQRAKQKAREAAVAARAETAAAVA
ncbi:MAG: 30S ribosomal protein S6 [bacterium]